MVEDHDEVQEEDEEEVVVVVVVVRRLGLHCFALPCISTPSSSLLCHACCCFALSYRLALQPRNPESLIETRNLLSAKSGRVRRFCFGGLRDRTGEENDDARIQL